MPKDNSSSIIIVQCPHCNGDVVIQELNCKIFRHGVHKKDGKQINPHAPKSECDALVEKDLIHGCGKPFLVKQKGSDYKADVCDYI